MILTVDEIFGKDDFKSIVNFAIKKYKLINYSHDDYDDFFQELYLFMRKYPKPENIKVTTYIIRACKWTSSAIKRSKMQKNFNNPVEIHENMIYHNHQGYYEVDQHDHEHHILSSLTDRQKDILSRKLQGKTNSQIVSEVGCSKQNVNCVVGAALKNILAKKSIEDKTLCTKPL